VSSKVYFHCILFCWSDDLGKGFDPGVFGRFDLAALAQPHLKLLFACFFVCLYPRDARLMGLVELSGLSGSLAQAWV
jgi:hypothetical protein